MELYRCKGRCKNPESFVEVKLRTDGYYDTIHHLKSGVIHKEKWSKEDLESEKKLGILTKATEIAWKEGEIECKPKRKATKKSVTKPKSKPSRSSSSKTIKVEKPIAKRKTLAEKMLEKKP